MKLTRQGRDALRFIAKTLVSSGTKPYQATATVISTNGTTATLRIDGADTTTPATLGVNVKPGDRVQVRVANSGVVVQGNNSAPPTDDAEALAAKVRAQIAKDAADTAQTTAESAQETADGALAAAESAQETADGAAIAAEATNQHFWHRSTDPDSDGAGTGAFVTDEEQDDFLSAIASGTAPTTARPLHNLLMNAEGILIRAATRIRAAFTPSGVAFFDGQGNQDSNVNAAFGSDGFQVGQTDKSHLVGDYHSLQLIDKGSNVYFHVSDLRDATGYAVVTTTARVPSTWAGLRLELQMPAGQVVELQENGVTVSPSDYEFSTASHYYLVKTDGTAWDSTTKYTVTYTTASQYAKAYTLGQRSSGSLVGAMSLAEGWNIEASGHSSHAEGYFTEASGDMAHAEGEQSVASGSDSHAEGGSSVASGAQSHAQNQATIAASEAQTALGKYNVADSSGTYAVIIGNGTASNRSNALTVDWSGNVEVAGSVKPGNVTAGRAVITGANGELATSSVTSTELYRLAGITSNVQNQLDSAKTTASVQHVTTTLTATIAANGSASGTLQATIPSGYTPVSVMCSALSNAFLMDVRVLSTDTSGLITYYIRNTSTASTITSGTATFVVACVKTA